MMNSANKLSVIIPLYNAGNDFNACMESLIAQTWTALEIIIVNDGSTDNSVEIAKYYAKIIRMFVCCIRRMLAHR